MTGKLENICANCHAFRSVSYAQDDEKGICLLDPAFDPYLDEIIDQDNFAGCRQLVQEKMFSGEQEACSLYDEIDFPEDCEALLDVEQEFDGLPIPQVECDKDIGAKYSFGDHSFRWLLEHDGRLRALRSQYEKVSTQERRMAADMEYHSVPGVQLFRQWTEEPAPTNELPGEVVALAIDPCYAPALLTVGTHEILLGREEEGMQLLLSLVELPAVTEDLNIIIDKAGRFLLDRSEGAGALTLYSKAAEKYPKEQMFQAGLAACRSC